MSEADSPSTLPPGDSGGERAPRGRTLVLVHGRGRKPDAATLEGLWVEALRHGLKRDFGKQGAVERLDAVTREFVWFGDLTAGQLDVAVEGQDAAADAADLRFALDGLRDIGRKKFRRVRYEALPGKTAVKEFMADFGAPLLFALGLYQPVLRRVLPEYHAYLCQRAEFAETLRMRVRAALLAGFERGDDIMVVGHCLGSVAAFDVLWELSRGEGAHDHFGHRITEFVTLGSPLADEFVKRRLLGHGRGGRERYPSNLLSWSNLAAEDDYCCHDETVANDYSAMRSARLISQIRDYRIYNLALRWGRSNPHNALGYLVHPRMTRLLASWLGCSDA